MTEKSDILKVIGLLAVFAFIILYVYPNYNTLLDKSGTNNLFMPQVTPTSTPTPSKRQDVPLITPTPKQKE